MATTWKTQRERMFAEAREAQKRMTDAKAARLLRAAADEQEACKADYQVGGKWYDAADEEGNLGMVDMYERDAWSLRGVADLIAAGEHERALQSAGRLDTACREEIPLAVWMFIGGEVLG